MLAHVALGTLLSACPGGSPPLVEPRLIAPIELAQGPLAVPHNFDYAGSVRLHLLLNALGPFRVGPTVAASSFGGVRNLGAGGRAELRVAGGSIASFWVGGEYLAPLAGTRTYGGTLGAELARAVRVNLRTHRVPARDAWLHEIGVGVDLRYLVARSGYIPRDVPRRVDTTPRATVTIYDLATSESASASAPLAEGANGALRDAVSRQLDAMRRQQDLAALRSLLSSTGLDTVARWMSTAFDRALEDAAANNPPTAVPAWDAASSHRLVRALVAGVEQNLCRNAP